MEVWIRAAWFSLAAVHAPPAAVAFAPALAHRLYAVSPDGPAAVLLTHRGAMFLAVVAASLFAAFDPGARRACVAVVAISVVGYLVVYALAGMPDGPLRTVALVDAAALVPLALAAQDAWRT